MNGEIATRSYIQTDGGLVPLAQLSPEERRAMPDQIACRYFREALRRYGVEVRAGHSGKEGRVPITV